jgi:hypothetical protein
MRCYQYGEAALPVAKTRVATTFSNSSLAIDLLSGSPTKLTAAVEDLTKVPGGGLRLKSDQGSGPS